MKPAILLGAWLLLSLAIGAAAASRGRSWVAWSALCFLSSLVISVLMLEALPEPGTPDLRVIMLEFGWLALSLLTAPVICVLALLVMPDLKIAKLAELRHKELIAAIRGDKSGPATS